MPKDEFDFEDPLELNGVGLFTHEDTSGEMAECFIEEFLRLGYNHKQIFALFQNPHYIGMNMVLQNRGEDFVRERISEVFARWGKQVQWPAQKDFPEPISAATTARSHEQLITLNSSASDPMGNPIPKLD